MQNLLEHIHEELDKLREELCTRSHVLSLGRQREIRDKIEELKEALAHDESE